MMNSEQIAKYISEHNLGGSETKTEEQVAPVEEVKVEETPAPASNDDSKSDMVETKTSDQIEDKQKEEATKPVEEPKVENKDDNKESEKKEVPQYSQQEKVNYAFQREKAKRKKLENRIKELEEENSKLKAVNPADFKDDYNKLIDYSVNQRLNEAELKRVREEYQSSQDAEFAEINRQRILNCYPDEIEQHKYDELVKKEGPSFVKRLDEDDKEGAVWAYLDDSDISPLLTRILMTSEKYYDEIMKYKSPYGKYRALDKLAEKVEMAREQMAKEKTPVSTQPAQVAKPVEQVKPAIPVIGSVTKGENEGNSTRVVDYNQILHQMNLKRGYGR